MLFNSSVFILFFIVVFTLYLLFRRQYKIQNILLLISSYIFYGYWDWRFLFLIALSTVIDFYVGKQIYIEKKENIRKFLLLVSIAANLSILGFFKYFNFFADSLIHIFNIFGFKPDFITLNIILPVGISFYTFQTMSYTFDIYRGEIKPTNNILNFALFVSFFPQLVAGPIERAKHLLPQMERPRKLVSDQIYAGVYLIIWGYFKKMVIADNLGFIADEIFNGYESFFGLDLLFGLLAFTFQIYGDFSGYSDIARGLSKLMGFDIMINFKLPYFSINPSDFWRRWHISLSSWLRDYLYIPLGGNKSGKIRTYINLFITMLLGGLWHGAAWNFVIWGGYQGSLLILYRMLKNKIKLKSKNFVLLKLIYYFSIFIMFLLTIIGWLIFRSSSIDQITHFMFNFNFSLSNNSLKYIFELIFYTSPLIVIQIMQHKSNNLLVMIDKPKVFIILMYVFMIVWILIFGVRESPEFIYFQF